MSELIKKGKLIKKAAYTYKNVSGEDKNQLLKSIQQSLQLHKQDLLDANKKDIEAAKKQDKTASFIDRLTLNDDRLDTMIHAITKIMKLDDPCGKVLEAWSKNDLQFFKVSQSLGVIGMIYEARPNVGVDASILCLKSGNACFLRGSKDTLASNKALVQVIKEGIHNAGFDEHLVELLEDTSHEQARKFMQLNEYIDVLIPRGSARLIKTTMEQASIPVIETGSGNCHVYVDKDADIEMAIKIIVNAKCQRVSVCNACESILLHEDIVDAIVPSLIQALQEQHVLIHGDAKLCEYSPSIVLANDEDYGKEYLDYEVSMKVVTSMEEAMEHIETYSTHHSEVIVTNNQEQAAKFLAEVDSAVVYHNASSRFSDGEEFGFGAEIGISTQKLHARGPMGLEALTSYKYLVKGEGKIRE